MSKLYVVPTPIGNLEDITRRAIRVLKEVDLILCEDTRTSGRLLKHHQIEKPLRSYHMHNEHRVVEGIITLITDSDIDVALISDSGTPAISDPGFLLVRSCIESGVEVECLPGATAFVPAMVNSGFPCNTFVFRGFLPVKKGRQKVLKKLSETTETQIIYESPHRILKTLSDLKNTLGESRFVSVSRELTKIHEQTLRGTIAELEAHFLKTPPKGEFSIVIKGI